MSALINSSDSLHLNNLLNHLLTHQASSTLSDKDLISSSEDNILLFLLSVFNSLILQLKKTDFKKKNIFIKKAAVKYKTSKITDKKITVKLLEKALISKKTLVKASAAKKASVKTLILKKSIKQLH